MCRCWVIPLLAVAAMLADGRPPITGSEAAPKAPPRPTAPAPVPVFRVLQPVQKYFLPFGQDIPAGDVAPWAYYTHLGTDYGLMGPGQRQIAWRPGELQVDLTHAGWAGMWHSLAGVIREKDQHLDFLKCYPSWVRDEYQTRCVGIGLRVGGQGTLKLEIVSPAERTLWQRTEVLPPNSPTRELVFDCLPDQLRDSKQLNWVAEPGSRLNIDSLELLLDYPPIPFATRVFLISYAKLARCYVPADGHVKDRAHFPAGTFDTVPGSGLFCLATCAAWRIGIVDQPFAEQALRQVQRSVAALPRARGLLPHFITRDHGRYHIHHGTEYSTIDTSIYYHSMLLAAQMLADKEMLAELTREVQAIRFDQLRDRDGFVVLGLRDDGRTPLPTSWRQWGGETALVLLLEEMAAGKATPLKMERSGKVHDGIGFISEIQSLFYPDFARDQPDAVSGVNWLQARRQLLKEQMDYFPRTWPNAAASRMGLYGLSAGEGWQGRDYVADGTADANVQLIHPHYLLMSGLLRGPAETYPLLQAMETNGLLPPWGMVENMKADLSEYMPMIGSLNASFECLSAYHLRARATGEQDQIYVAAATCPLLKDAVQAFYPR